MLITAAAVAVLTLGASQIGDPAPPAASRFGTQVTVAGQTCTVKAGEPESTTSRSGQRIVSARVRVSECQGETSAKVTSEATLERCTQLSYGCLWRAVSDAERDAPAPEDQTAGEVITARATESCVDGRYRLIGTLTLRVGDSHASTRDVSRVADVSC